MSNTNRTITLNNTSYKKWGTPLLLLMSFALLSLGSFGQSVGEIKIDSLRTVLGTAHGPEKIAAQLDLALQLADRDTNEAQQLSQVALLESKKINNRQLKMRSYFVMGRIYTKQNKKKQSLAYLDSALQICEAIDDQWYKGDILFRIGVNKHQMGEKLEALEIFNEAVQACRLSDNFKVMGSVYSMMGTIFRINGLYDRAIEYIIKAKLNYEKAAFTEGSAWSAYLLGRTYFDLKLYDQALDYFTEALEIYMDLAAIDGIQNGLAICYEQIGLLKLETGHLDEARQSINKTLKIYTESNSKLGMSNVYSNLGKIEYFSGNYQLAEEHLEKSLQLKTETNNLLGLPRVYEYLGLSRIKTGRKEEGFKNVQLALDMAVKNNQKKVELDIYSHLTGIYLSLNDLKNAVIAQNKQIEIQNLLLSGGANIKAEQLQDLFEIDEKNNQIAELEKQNQINVLTIKQNRTIRNVMILSIVLAFFVLAVIYLFYIKLRHKNRELKETNAAKDKFFAIIAHDLRGPTGALTAVLKHLNSSFDDFSKKELKELMDTLHNSAENVSSLLENLLLWAQSQVRNIDYKPTKIDLNEMLLNAQKGAEQSANNKEITIQLESIDEIVVNADPNMAQTILRNILGNAIKFSHRGGKVIIRSQLKDKNSALIQIIDSGVGINEANLSKLFDITSSHHTKGTEGEQSTGLGLILVKEFVKKNRGTFAIESKKNKGTTVSFTLPVA